MHKLYLHQDVEKTLKKAPKKIQKRAFLCLQHLRKKGLHDFPYRIGILQGAYKKFKYIEAKIDKDFRLIFRYEDDAFFIRYAGTHNALGTG